MVIEKMRQLEENNSIIVAWESIHKYNSEKNKGEDRSKIEKRTSRFDKRQKLYRPDIYSKKYNTTMQRVEENYVFNIRRF